MQDEDLQDFTLRILDIIRDDSSVPNHITEMASKLLHNAFHPEHGCARKRDRFAFENDARVQEMMGGYLETRQVEFVEVEFVPPFIKTER